MTKVAELESQAAMADTVDEMRERGELATKGGDRTKQTATLAECLNVTEDAANNAYRRWCEVRDVPEEKASQRQIAKTIGVSDMTVGRDAATNVAPPLEQEANNHDFEPPSATNVAPLSGADAAKAAANVEKKAAAAVNTASRRGSDILKSMGLKGRGVHKKQELQNVTLEDFGLARIQAKRWHDPRLEAA